MKTRRSFIRSLVCAIAAAPIMARMRPQDLLPAPEPQRTEINPAWKNARYEVDFILYGANSYLGRSPLAYTVDEKPIRFVFDTATKSYKMVEP